MNITRRRSGKIKKSNSKLFFLSLTILIFQNIYIIAQPSLLWAKQLGGTGNDYAASIATDPSGNVYSVGHFAGTADFDPGAAVYNLTSNGNNDFYVSKLDASGNFVWACSFGSTNSDYAISIVVDASNNVCIGGYFQGTVDFDPGIGIANLTSAGGNDVFILKLNQNGNYVWCSRIGGALGDDFSSLTIDGAGNTYATGGFAGTSDFDPGPGVFNLTANGSADAFVLKLDIAGSYLWAKKMGGSGADYGQGIVTDGSGNVITNGWFNGVSDFDPNIGVFNLSENGNGDIYVSMLNSAGNFVWAKQIGGTGGDVPNSLEISSTGNLLMTGQFNAIADFDPGIGTYTLSSVSTDEFILKLDPTGNFLWAYQFGALTSESAMCVRTDLLQNVYIIGRYTGTVDFDLSPAAYTLTSAGGYDVFILKLDGLGNFIWANQLGGNGQDYGESMCLDLNNNIYSTGFFTGTADFDPNIGITNLISFGGSDSFVHKMNQCSVPVSPTNITSSFNQNICSSNSTTLIASGSGTLNWYSTPTSTSVINTGTIYITPVLSAGTYTYYIDANTCTVSIARTPVTVTVNPLPTIGATTNNTLLCIGQSATLNANGAATYTFNPGGAGASISVSPTVTTSYTITGTDALGCSNTFVLTQSVSACTGINSFNSNSAIFIIYPNPSNGVFIISGIALNTSISVYNTLGELIKTLQSEIVNAIIDLSEYSNGIYFIKIKNSNEEAIHRLIKQ